MHSLLSRVSLGAAVALVLVLRSSNAGAQSASAAPTSTDANQQERASKLTDDAIAAEATGNYLTAITFYKQAYQLIPHPLLEFNIGQDYMLVGNFEEAEKFFRRYLQFDPDGPGASTARKFLASRPAQPPEPAPPVTGGTRVTTGTDGERPHPVPTSASPTIREGNSDISADDRQRVRDSQLRRADEIKFASYMMMSVGGLMIVAGLGFASQDDEEFGLGAALTGVGFVGGGIVALAYSMQQRHAAESTAASSTPHARRVAWSPVIGPGFAGVALAGSLP